MGSASLRAALRRRPNHRLTALLLGLVTALVLNGCGLLNGPSTPDNPVPGAAVEKSTINIGILAAVDFAPIKIAELTGIFRGEGLDAHVHVFPAGPPTLASLNHGDLDFTLVNYVTFFQAVTASPPQDLKIVSDAFQADSGSIVLLAKDGAGITRPQDLIGRTVSVHQRKSIADLLLQAVLHDNGVDPAQVKLAEVKFPDELQALNNDQIAAGVELEPYIRLGEDKFGLKALAGSLTLIAGQTDNFPIGGYAVEAKFAQTHPKTVAAFQRAMRKAAQVATDDRGKVEDVLPELTGVDKATAAQVHIGRNAYPTSLDATRLQRVVTLMGDYGAFPAGVDATTVKAADYIVPTPSR